MVTIRLDDSKIVQGNSISVIVLSLRKEKIHKVWVDVDR